MDGQIKNVLLIEGDSEDREAVLDQLESMRSFYFQVSLADTVKEARSLLKDDEYDLVFIDTHMNEARGHSFIQEVHNLRLDTHTVVIAMVQEGSKKERIEAFEAGADECLNKPVRKIELEEIIHEFVGGLSL